MIGIIKINFTQDEYIIPNPPMSNFCMTQNDSLPVPPFIMLQLDKPASAKVNITIAVKEQGQQSKRYISAGACITHPICYR